VFSIGFPCAFSLAKNKQMGVARHPLSSFVARFGQSKIGAVGLISSGVKREANRLDAEKYGLILERIALQQSD